MDRIDRSVTVSKVLTKIDRNTKWTKWTDVDQNEMNGLNWTEMLC